MTLETLIRSELWTNFQKQARKQKQEPSAVLAKLLREYLKIAEDLALTEAMRRDVRKSGYKERDAVEIVREYRAERGRSVPPRKARVPVVLDTNVVVGFFSSKTRRSANALVFDSWLISRRLQLIVSLPLIAEYFALLERMGIEISRIESFRKRLAAAPTVTRIKLRQTFRPQPRLGR